MSEPTTALDDGTELVMDDVAIRRAGYITGEFLPCPFCGKPEPFASETRKLSPFDGKLRYQARVDCMNDTDRYNGMSCHAGVSFNAFTLAEAREGARARWNRRTP